MSNVTIHLVIPVLVLIATRLFPTKQVIMWAPFALVPDLDTALNLISFYAMGDPILAHRSFLHNIFVFMPTLILALVLWYRMLGDQSGLAGASWEEKWRAFSSVRWGYASVLVTFFLFSHVFLDMFQGGVTLFWPFVNTYVYPQIFIWVDMTTGMPSGEANVVTGPGAPTLSRRFPWLTPEQIGIWILVLMGAAASIWRESARKMRTKDPSASAGGAQGPVGEADDGSSR